MLLAQYGYVQLKPLDNSSSAATSSKASLAARISSEPSSKTISPPCQYHSRSGRLVNATGDLKRALQNSGQDVEPSVTGLVSHSSSASSNGNSVSSFSQAPEAIIGDVVNSVQTVTATKRAAPYIDGPSSSVKRSRVLDLEAPSATDNPTDEGDKPFESIVDLDADDDDDDDEEEPYAVEDLEAEEEETESEETSETEPSHSELDSTLSPEPHYGLSSLHKHVALDASDSEDSVEGSVEKSQLKLGMSIFYMHIMSFIY